MTRPYAEVIGDPISHSKSPTIHNFWLAKLGIDAEYRRCHVRAEELADYFARRRGDAEWRGCNVTMPHKQAVMRELYDLDYRAEAAGAVNTVTPQSDRTLTGTNTDGMGFIEPLRPLLDSPEAVRTALVIGTGGAARAIVWELSENRFHIILAGRDPGKAQAVLETLAPAGEHLAVDLSRIAAAMPGPLSNRTRSLDLVVNASPLGMRGQPPLAFDWCHAPHRVIAYDIVTDPVVTPFLRAAKAAGHDTIDGLAMLIGQASAAFEKFFGQPAPREHDAELRALLTA